MQRCIVVLGLLCILSESAFAQYYRNKDLLFAQVVGGSDFESAITITNRGSQNYTGTLFFQRAAGVWNPTVNGVALTDGSFPVSLPPGHTATFRVTESGLQAGSVILFSSNLSLRNQVEGNLTYFRTAGGEIADSVGVPPSADLYRTSLPFESFASVGLALASGVNATATVRLILRGANGAVVRETAISLPPFGHDARFLSEHFNGVSLTGGRIDIESDLRIFATALSLFEGQISTLPLLPSPTSYSVQTFFLGSVSNGQLMLWSEGELVQGYLVFTSVDGVANPNPSFLLVGGTLQGSTLRIAFHATGPEFLGEEVIIYGEVQGFSFARNSFSGLFTETFLSTFETFQGDFSAVKAP